MVVVEDLHVVYRVFGSNADKGTAATALLRLIKRQRRPSIREVHAIRGMSFVAYRGDAVGVIGRTGSGCSVAPRLQTFSSVRVLPFIHSVVPPTAVT
jgi:teichoic acid transport system ATP-binding protein